MSLFGYVLRSVAVRVLAAGLVVLAVLQVLDLLEITSEIIERGLGAGGMAKYALLRAPRLIDQAAPLAMLTGAIFAFMKLAGESQIVAIRASGVSIYRLVSMCAPAAIAVMVVNFIAVEVVAPRTDPILQTWWAATAPRDEAPKREPQAFRVGSDVVVATPVDTDGRNLSAVRIYRRDEQGRLIERIDADSASFVRGGGWRLVNPQFVRFMKSGIRRGEAGHMTWASSFEPRDVRAVFSKEPDVSALSSARALSGGGAERPASFYATHLQRSFAHPAGALVMLLLAAPVALANFRSGQGGTFVVASLAAGLTFIVADGLLTAMGESGAVGPALASWTGPAVFAALGASALLRLEG